MLPLYKYLDVKGGLLTLSNKNFRHAKPSEFNDQEDMTVQRLFPEEEIESLTLQMNNFTEIILRNLDRIPTCADPIMRSQVSIIQNVYRNNPNAAELVKQTVQNDRPEDIYDLEHLRKARDNTLQEINEHLQGYRVLCLSANRNSERMWNRYADKHEGIVIGIIPNVEKDSKFRLSKKVEYKEERPPLFPSTIEFVEDSLFGNHEKTILKYVDTVIYTKTKEWEYEDEYRLAIFLFSHENWNTLPFHSEEISELYLGLNISDENKKKFVALAQAINPSIKIFQVIRDRAQELDFLSI